MNVFSLFGEIGINGVSKAQSDLGKVTNTAEKSSNVMVKAFKKIGMAAAAAFSINAIKKFGVEVVKTSAEVSAEAAAFTQIMGDYTDAAAKKVSKIAEATGITDTRLNPYMTSMTAKFKGLGNDIETATDYATRGLNLAADASAFWDKSLDESMSHLNSFINGSYEGGEAIGLFANDTQMAAYAVEKGIVKSTSAWAKLDEKTKQATRLEYAENMMKQSGAIGQAAKESGAYQNVMANLVESWRQFKALVGEPILQNIVLPAAKALTNFITNTLTPKFKEMQKWINENKEEFKRWGAILLDVAKAVGVSVLAIQGFNILNKINSMFKGSAKAIEEYTLKMILATTNGMVFNATLSARNIILGVMSGQIGIATAATMLWEKAQKKLNLVLTANPIGLIIAGITALIAILIVAYKKNENFRNAVKSLWKEIKTGLQPVIEALKPLLKAIIDLFKQIWQLIKAVVIPIFNLFVSRITSMIQIIAPILNVLLNIFSKIFTAIAKVIEPVINLITKIINKITDAVNAVKNGIEKIKNFFKFKWELPKLKMPHFSIKGKFSLAPPQVPKLGIEWYKEGGILTEPTAFGFNPYTNNTMVGGEAGPEAILPLDTLDGKIRNAVQLEISELNSNIDRLIGMLADYLPQIITGQNRPIVMDGGALVGQMINKIDYKLGEINTMKGRGN